jgi:hypothetical protein
MESNRPSGCKFKIRKRKFRWIGHILTLNLLTTTTVAPPSNASKWQMGFNSAFKGLRKEDGEVPKAALLWNPQGSRKRGRPD